MCNSTSTKIDLVITDLVMPGMGGHMLAAKLKERFPGLHVLFTSGYTADSAVRRELLQSGNPFLEKPYTVAALCDTVQETLVKQYQHSTPELDAEAVNGSTSATQEKLVIIPGTS
jgi:YesN/AraC family two-component response regulator